MALEADDRQKRTVLLAIWFLTLCVCAAMLLDVTRDGPHRFPTWFEARFAIFFELYTVAVAYELQAKCNWFPEDNPERSETGLQPPARLGSLPSGTRHGSHDKRAVSPKESAEAESRDRGT